MIDITPTIKAAGPVFPGDAALVITEVAGGEARVTKLCVSPHMGAHVDAPSHLNLKGDAASIDPERLMGPCVVIDATHRALIDEDAIPEQLDAPRVLIKTGFVMGSVWRDDFAVLTPAAARKLVRLGADVVGIDTPSVDAVAAEHLPVHHVLMDAGVLILENLYLQKADLGRYILVALPLKIEGLEASPVRAVLLETQHARNF